MEKNMDTIPSPSHNSFKTRSTLKIDNKNFLYHSLTHLALEFKTVNKLPKSLKILLENLLRYEDGINITPEHIKALIHWQSSWQEGYEILFYPSRIVMQDLSGVPAIVDLAAMREALAHKEKDPQTVNPRIPVDFVIDHSLMVDAYGRRDAYKINVTKEFERNRERYEFIKWAQQSFKNFRVIPPGMGIIHQVNLEYLSEVIALKEDNEGQWLIPDSNLGTDSHTPMVNGLSVLAWGVGGIEAEAALLGEPVSLPIPEVIGFKLTGQLNEGVNATDLVLTITELLRKEGVVGKFIEYYGSGLHYLSVQDRATISNMSPENGSTIGFFPIDSNTLDYLKLTGKSDEIIQRVEHYARAQGLWHEIDNEPEFPHTITLDISTIEPSIAGPKRPQDRLRLEGTKDAFLTFLKEREEDPALKESITINGEPHTLKQGDIAIAAITSCTNTSNPSVMLAAGLLAKKARKRGLSTQPWVKTSLAPGSRIVTDYLDKTNLSPYLDELGFNLVGYGCTTCAGNSGPLIPEVEAVLTKTKLTLANVLSGNRNFEGRIHSQVKTSWLTSPPLVVAYALAGTIMIDLTREAIGLDKKGEPVYLKDIWPSHQELSDYLETITDELYLKGYKDVFQGDALWQEINVDPSPTYRWEETSTYIQKPPYFKAETTKNHAIANKSMTPSIDSPFIKDARVLVWVGDSFTTDHISPAGEILTDSVAGKYLKEKGVHPHDFNSYGSRRGNHNLMMRGAFANIRIRNRLVDGLEGGFTRYLPSNSQGNNTLGDGHIKEDYVNSIYDIAMRYQRENTPTLILAGKEYGTGSSRDWAAKGPALLGIKTIIAESFERIHRTNLVGMGVLPLQFKEGQNADTLGLQGDEYFTILTPKTFTPKETITVQTRTPQGLESSFKVILRLDTSLEINHFKAGGILPYVLTKEEYI